MSVFNSNIKNQYKPQHSIEVQDVSIEELKQSLKETQLKQKENNIVISREDFQRANQIKFNNADNNEVLNGNSKHVSQYSNEGTTLLDEDELAKEAAMDKSNDVVIDRPENIVYTPDTTVLGFDDFANANVENHTEEAFPTDSKTNIPKKIETLKNTLVKDVQKDDSKNNNQSSIGDRSVSSVSASSSVTNYSETKNNNDEETTCDSEEDQDVSKNTKEQKKAKLTIISRKDLNNCNKTNSNTEQKVNGASSDTALTDTTYSDAGTSIIDSNNHANPSPADNKDYPNIEGRTVFKVPKSAESKQGSSSKKYDNKEGVDDDDNKVPQQLSNEGLKLTKQENQSDKKAVKKGEELSCEKVKQCPNLAPVNNNDNLKVEDRSKDVKELEKEISCNEIIKKNYKLIRLSTKEEVTIKGDRFIVGKSKYSTYQIRGNNTVSRSHALFTIEDSELYITDMCSKNGTFVDGKNLKEKVRRKLEDGSVIRMSDEAFEISITKD